MKYKGELVGLSYARSYKEIEMWKNFLETLKVKYKVSSLALNKAAEIGQQRFRYAQEYCYTRKVTLGEYVNLVENEGCNILLVASRVVEGNIKCNTTRYVPLQISEYYKDEGIKVIDAPVSTDERKARQQLYKLAEYFSDEELLIENAVEQWFANPKVSKRKKGIDKDKINIFFMGGAPFHFSFSDPESYMTRYLREHLDVNVVGPKSASEEKNVRVYRDAYKRVYHDNLINCDREAYWARPAVLATYLNVKDNIDGVIFVRDKYCTCKMEELDLIHEIINKEGCPNIVVDYREESRSSIETVLETFIEMIKLGRKAQ